MKIVNKLGLLFSVGAMLGGLTLPAFAQQGSQGGILLEEIIVTSQRREESVQDIPVAVTALSADQLEIRQVSNFADLQYQIPNINMSKNTGTSTGARIFLRGVGEDESRPTADPAIGTYVDGVYLGRAIGGLFDLMDVERVEVLRGPQGTLYGRNSNGGAIKFVSKAPQTDENTLDLKLTAGSDGLLGFRAVGNLAISDSTAIRATVLSEKRDGFFTLNPNGDFANLAGTEVGEKDVAAFRIALLHDFSEDWSLSLAFDHTNDESDPTPDSANPGDDADNNIYTVEPIGTTVCSAALPAAFLQLGCFSAYAADVETQGLTMNITGGIGDFTFNSITARRELDDSLATRIGFTYFQETDQEQFSQEFTLSSNYDGAFNFVTGLYYYDESIDFEAVFAGSPSGINIETEALAAFFQSTFDFSDTLSLTTGIRYTDETKDPDAFQINTFLPTTPRGTQTQSADFTNTSYKIALDNQFTENVMGYVSYSTGFKSGGWSPDCFQAVNGPSPGCFRAVQEEEVAVVELGLRSDLFDGRLRLNATYFANAYDGLQIAASVPGLGFTRFNVNEAEINGFEFEAVLQATDNLAFTANLGLLDTEYTDLDLDQAGGLTNGGATPACGGVVSIECAKTLTMKFAGDYKGAIGVVHTADLAGGELITSLDVSFEDDHYSLVANDPAHSLIDVGAMINARVAYKPDNGNWNLALWGKNLGDEQVARATSGGSFTTYAGDPLTWGVDVGFSF